MTKKGWGAVKGRRDNIRALRQKEGSGPRLPDFLGGDSHPNDTDTGDSFTEDIIRDTDSHQREKRVHGKVTVTMNKISFISIVFGMILIGILVFSAGMMTAYYILPGGPQAIGTAIKGGGIPQVPNIHFPTKEEIAQSIERAVSKLGKAPKKQDVEQAIQTAVKAVTPEIIDPLVDAIAPSKKTESEFVEGKKRTPTDNDAGRFTVQAKVYGDGAWAMQLARKLQSVGYGAYIVRIKEPHSDRLHYHTRVGVFADYMSANAMVRKLREMGNRSATVVLITRGEDRTTP